ncbi:hypothetical protein D3C84_720630 [compost metagenome]
MNAQRITLGKALRLPAKHRGDSRGTDNELRHQREAFKGHRHASMNAQLMQMHRIHGQVSPIGKLTHYMLGGAVARQAQAPGELRLLRTDDAAQLVTHQGNVGISRVQAALRHNHTITAAIVERFADHIAIARHGQVAQTQTHTRRDVRQRKTDRWQQHCGHIIGSHQGKLPSTGGRVEIHRGIDNLPCKSEGLLHLGHQLQPQCRRFKPSPDLNQQRVIEMLAQAP